MSDKETEVHPMSVESGQATVEYDMDVDDPVRRHMCEIIRDHRVLLGTLWGHFVALILLSLSTYLDILSDVSWDFKGGTNFDTIYYDCGWNQLRIEYDFVGSPKKISETHKYSNDLCKKENNDYKLWTEGFCNKMSEIGTVWVILNIIAVFFAFICIILVFKQLQSIKWSVSYLITNFTCILCICIGCGFWWDQELCSMKHYFASDYVIRSTVGMYVLFS